MRCLVERQQLRRQCRFRSAVIMAAQLSIDRQKGCTCQPDEVDYETAHDGDGGIEVWIEHGEGCPCAS